MQNDLTSNRSNQMLDPNQTPRGFTLVELLVVIGIIALLISILLPALTRAKEKSRQVSCLSNIHQISVALNMYDNDNHDHYPDKQTVGNYIYRRQPGLRDPLDPSSRPEWLGIAGLLQGIRPSEFNTGMTIPAVTAQLTPLLNGHSGYLPARNNVWICPSATDQFIAFGNTYCYSIAKPPFTPPTTYSVGDLTSNGRGNPNIRTMYLLYDNVNLLPYTCGTIPAGSVVGYTLNTTVYPHRGSNGKTHGQNVLFVNGSVQMVSADDQGNIF